MKGSQKAIILNDDRLNNLIALKQRRDEKNSERKSKKTQAQRVSLAMDSGRNSPNFDMHISGTRTTK